VGVIDRELKRWGLFLEVKEKKNKSSVGRVEVKETKQVLLEVHRGKIITSRTTDTRTKR